MKVLEGLLDAIVFFADVFQFFGNIGWRGTLIVIGITSAVLFVLWGSNPANDKQYCAKNLSKPQLPSLTQDHLKQP